MPIRPALAAMHLRLPRPHEQRRVACPHCGSTFHLSRRAMSATCPRCTQHLQFEDVQLSDRVEGDVATMGHIRLEEPSEMVGRIVCGGLTSAGRFKGRATVYGPVELLSGSRTEMHVTARSLRIDRGALMIGKVHVTPNPRASAMTRKVADRSSHRVRRTLVPRA